jgi:hypothetical protein
LFGCPQVAGHGLFFGHKWSVGINAKPRIPKVVLGWHGCCFQVRVQKTGHFARLLRLFAAKKVFYIITFLVIFAAIRVDSQRPILAVAIVRHDIQQKESFVAIKSPVEIHDLFATSIASPHADFFRKDEKKIPADLKKENITDLSWDALCEKSDDSDQFNLIRLVHKRLGVNGRSEQWLDVQAGYGAACFDHADMEKIEPNWQEPGCLYVKASFSF